MSAIAGQYLAASLTSPGEEPHNWFPSLRAERHAIAAAVRKQVLIVLLAALTVPTFAACVSTGSAAEQSTGRGKELIAEFGCGACHVVPGIRSAQGVVGPPLTAFARRAYIAGQVPNTADNLVRWLMNPQSIEPGTAMPNLGLRDPAARDIVAYLYTLR
jgi:cytochrome c1